MNEYIHHVSGFFAHREEAHNALTSLVERGLPSEHIHIFETDADVPASAQASKSKEVLKDVLVDGAIGTAIGTGVGALGEIALLVTNVSLFIASPLLAPIVMMGWGATIGALIGASAGATSSIEHKDGKFAELIGDAISNGQFVLVVKTKSEQETAIARDVIQKSVGDYNDINKVWK
ncbi:hypothetical protein [Sulfuriferula nivalis]|uniref:DUF1269 domain-containing protein n=1 Tax=Sulfuriferula nivalis TaxID=2675298 RepID=A0A809RIA5_9PROT|nr:hypothetical protein [Sulfuriferula nivalis]BBP01336.1 hypothetical protein SFSGTM_20440 [Sulfuriferula nivalis]